MSTKTLIIYLTLAFLLLFLLHHHSPSSPHHHHHPRRLKLRPLTANTTTHHSPIPFDPLISDIDLHRQDREWEKTHFNLSSTDDSAPGAEAQPEWEDFMDAEDYINDEERFNVTYRIVSLFPKIDVGPTDGFVSGEELARWNHEVAAKEVMHRSRRDMELHDRNKDGSVSFQEYEAPSWARNFGGNASNGMGWWKEDHFNASDMNGDGLLNVTEFNDFLHPADSTNPRLIHWLCEEEIRERDKDKDGKLNFQEYFRGLFDSLQNYDEVHDESEAKKLFKQLDLDNDGFLSADELKPVIGSLHPSEHYYAKQQVDYVLSQADADKDGRLSLKEMIEHPYVFYSSIFSDDDEDLLHDEFR